VSPNRGHQSQVPLDMSIQRRKKAKQEEQYKCGYKAGYKDCKETCTDPQEHWKKLEQLLGAFL
jgi:hypothetical protein